ncbi:hypothetical protein RHGRI_003837 [Rhododendron griersonianum]|uniref:Uncharacterized protein n=1 Tax=Rhododendron griersonianum TaxID=479676 RepID=A0AAV6L7A2_9ERIC|nr:hypothetical protein RHGRI_003837 [Rhododendron griersonianum]
MRLAITKHICTEIHASRLENFSSTACMCPTPKQQPNTWDCTKPHKASSQKDKGRYHTQDTKPKIKVMDVGDAQK